VPKWKDLIARGKPVPVTDLRATRFYMTQGTAVTYVMRLLDVMPSHITYPDLSAYCLSDLLRAFGDPSYIINGLPKYEKLHEELGTWPDGQPMFSNDAQRLTVDQLKKAIGCVN
jgi:UDP-N-acetylglucosamine 4,6-dehydratase